MKPTSTFKPTCETCSQTVSMLGSFVKIGTMYWHVHCYEKLIRANVERERLEAAAAAQAAAARAAAEAHEKERERARIEADERARVRAEELARLRAAQEVNARPLIERSSAPAVSAPATQTSTAIYSHAFNDKGICKDCGEGRATLKRCTGPQKKEEPQLDRFQLLDID